MELAVVEVEARAVGVVEAGPAEVDPTDVGGVGETGEVAGAVLIHAAVIGNGVGIAGTVGRGAIAHADPAEVGGVDPAGEAGGADGEVGVGARGEVDPAGVGGVGVGVRRGGGGRRGEWQSEESGEEQGRFHRRREAGLAGDLPTELSDEVAEG